MKVDSGRIVVRSEELRGRVASEQQRLKDEEGLELSMAQTAARLIRLGLSKESGRRSL